MWIVNLTYTRSISKKLNLNLKRSNINKSVLLRTDNNYTSKVDKKISI